MYEKEPRYMKPHYSEQILAIPWPLIISRFYYLWLFLNPFFIFLQHWESVKNCVPSSCYSWNWGRSYRFLPWISHLWAMSTHGWSPLGWRSRSQWRWTVWSISGKVEAIYTAWTSDKLIDRVKNIIWYLQKCCPLFFWKLIFIDCRVALPRKCFWVGKGWMWS